jgi:hypothetical protein
MINDGPRKLYSLLFAPIPPPPLSPHYSNKKKKVSKEAFLKNILDVFNFHNMYLPAPVRK